jgi:hypothetical protein
LVIAGSKTCLKYQLRVSSPDQTGAPARCDAVPEYK